MTWLNHQKYYKCCNLYAESCRKLPQAAMYRCNMHLKVSRGQTDPQFISNLHREQVTALFVLLILITIYIHIYNITLCTNTCYPTFNIQERIQNLFCLLSKIHYIVSGWMLWLGSALRSSQPLPGNISKLQLQLIQFSLNCII